MCFVCVLLAPFTFGLSIYFLIGYGCLELGLTQLNEQRMVINEAIVRSYRLEAEEQAILDSIHSSYVFPTMCQYCGEKIVLSKLVWSDTYEAQCPSCGAAIQTKIVS